MAKPCIGLYYPFWDFGGDGWIKRAVLYWDRVCRIAPRGVELPGKDSEVITALREAQLVGDVAPQAELEQVSEVFEQVLSRYESEITARYSTPDSFSSYLA